MCFSRRRLPISENSTIVTGKNILHYMVGRGFVNLLLSCGRFEDFVVCKIFILKN